MTSIAKEKEVALENECEKVRLKEQAERITREVNLIRADMAQSNSVARILTRDPRDVIVFNEEWFECR
jgi:hypothetical protein